MPTLSYYPSFDVCRIDAQGFRVTLALEDVEVYNITTDVSLGQLTSDAFGIIEEGSFTAAAGDVIRVSHLTYPEIVHFTLTATQEEAYTIVENDVSAYVVEDLSSTVDSPSAAAYFIDLDHPEIEPLYLGDVFPGTNTLAYTSPIAKNGSIRIISKAETLQTSGADFRTAEGIDVFVPGLTSGPRVLFEHFNSATTSVLVEETLRIYQIDAGSFSTDGDKIVAEYSGRFASNINEKVLGLKFNGTTFFNSDDKGSIIEDGTSWKIQLLLIRQSNTVLLFTVEIDTNTLNAVATGSITSLDLTANDYDLELTGTTSGLAGDIISEMAFGEFKPSSTAGTPYITFMGESLTFLGDEVTFT